MKTYIVATDVYCRYGSSEPLKLRMFEAKDLDDLALKINRTTLEEYQKGWDASPGEVQLSPWEELCESNGDGADYHTVAELVDGKLITVEM